MELFDWTLSKKIGKPCVKCKDEADAARAQNEFGGSIQQIEGVWYNVWPIVTLRADRKEQPYMQDILIRN